MTFSEPDFELLFVANYERLVQSLTAITGDRETARDCVQEAFIRASTRWSKVRRYDDPVTWIRRVAINRSRDLHRADRRRRRREARVAPVELREDHDDQGLVDGSLHLVALLETLPTQQRAAASLFYVEDLPISEIAGALGISAGAVKYHLNQARSVLRVAVEQEGQRHGG